MSDPRFTADDVPHRGPRPKRGEGQWALGFTEPLNKNESSPRRTTTRSTSATGSSTPTPARLPTRSTRPTCGRFRWMGLYTQRKPGIDGGKTAILEERLDDRYFMLRVRSDGKPLPADRPRLGQIGVDFARDTADVTDRENIQYHWIRIEDVPAIWGAPRRVRSPQPRACGDSPRRSSARRSPASRSTRSSTGPRRWPRSSAATSATPTSRTSPQVQDRADGPPVARRGAGDQRRRLRRHRPPEHGPGFDLWVGGGLSTNPMLAQKMGSGSRSTGPGRVGGRRLDLPRLRLPPAALARPPKFLVQDWGIEVPRGRREGVPRPALVSNPPRDAAGPPRPHRVHDQVDGRKYVGIAPTAGRVSGTLLVELADLMDDYDRAPGHAVPEDRADRRRAGGRRAPARPPRRDRLSGRPSGWRRNTMACTGIEFCKLAIVDTKNRARDLVDELEKRFPDLDAAITVNVNGCPNACARTQVADIGLKGPARHARGPAGRGVPGAPRRRDRPAGQLRAQSCAPQRSSEGLDDYVTALVTNPGRPRGRRELHDLGAPGRGGAGPRRQGPGGASS